MPSVSATPETTAFSSWDSFVIVFNGLKDWVWDVEDIVNNKEYASINHTKTVLKKKGCVQGLYSFPIERFIDEKSTLEALQEFLDFCKENDIAELEIM